MSAWIREILVGVAMPDVGRFAGDAAAVDIEASEIEKCASNCRWRDAN